MKYVYRIRGERKDRFASGDGRWDDGHFMRIYRKVAACGKESNVYHDVVLVNLDDLVRIEEQGPIMKAE